MGLQRFERRLEQLVEGAFTKAFRGGLQPVEIARRIVREMDTARTLGVRGTVVPNQFTVSISKDDSQRFEGFHDALIAELADAARGHARDERYVFEGPVTVELQSDDRVHRGELRVAAHIVGGGVPGSLVLPDGQRLELGDEPTVIGRLPECGVTLSDPQASRHHAEVRHDDQGWHIVDLNSTNGTKVNGTPIRDQRLADGDVIMIGATSIRYEES
ncbi:MAG TPA: DUF3662 and FHA domain-containing protein [Acidimicrobiia bacterium]|nr:DUF3662 and FHA domain-containing protein [Acidimicrobiia bacterium]